MSNTSNNLSNEELLATNAALKAQVEYLAKQVAELIKLKMNMVNTLEESDEEEEVPLEDNSSNTARGENYQRGANDFKVDIPTFEGKNDPDDFLEWLETVERVFDFKDVPEEKKVKIVALKFRKYASTWWSNLSTKRRRENKAPVKTWLKMRSLLKKKFLPEQYVRDNFARLQHLRQGPRSVEDYTQEFEELLMRYRLDPSHVISADTVTLDENLTYEEEPVEILARETRQLRNKTIPLVKVLWRSHTVEEATWETEESMRTRYPHLFSDQ
ncbi:unnamed protein product [Cuscuta campestris]|uniref:Retrotransposon gag domain-containing protein n=1 Tax=Cuscuta campestris TaxID=132261 RepID=A0A484MWR1_9ASTE|nr:unnamed protein product [Cuscuta campestris]